eukprot:Gb_38573 [translate_table: standard]
MASISSGILEFNTLSEQRIICGGFLLMQNVGRASPTIVCSSAHGNNANNRKFAGKKTKLKREAFALPENLIKRDTEKTKFRWWVSLLGWRPDDGSIKFDAPKSVVEDADNEERKNTRQSKFMPGKFTPEKAKLLRKNLMATASFHDKMYHSAIASRLASSHK